MRLAITMNKLQTTIPDIINIDTFDDCCPEFNI
jgi:hypothetical protein